MAARPASGDWPYPSLASRSFNEWRSSWYLQSVHQQVNMWCKTITTSLKPANVYCILVAWSLLPLYALWCSLLGLIRLISLNAMVAFMCPYKLEKSVFFILTRNIMNSCEPNGCIKPWLGKGYASPCAYVCVYTYQDQVLLRLLKCLGTRQLAFGVPRLHSHPLPL